MSVSSTPDCFRGPTLANEIRATLGVPGPADSPYSAEIAECYAVIAEQLTGEPDPDLCADLMHCICLLSSQDDEWRTSLWASRLGGI